MKLSGRRVVVMGLGRFGGGVGVARFLANAGAQVLVTDAMDREKLASSLGQLADLDLQFRLGGHDPADLDDADLLVVNPAVRPDHPFVAAAKQRGVALTSEMRLLAQHLPTRSRTIGVTGSAGKSTTTAMIGHALAKVLGKDRVHVGGNLGGSLLNRLDCIRDDDWVVLELSSFMLHWLDDDRWSPHIAVLTNIVPNHLDWHGDFHSYLKAKQVIFRHQDAADDFAVLRQRDRQAMHLDRGRSTRRVACYDDDTDGALQVKLMVPGEHNRMNAVLACGACNFAGADWEQVEQALADFPGLPHRLQCVGDFGKLRVYNDSKSTTPESAMLALRSFQPGTVHLIAGGYDKGSDLAPLAREAGRVCRGVYGIGATGDAIVRFAQGVGSASVHRCRSVQDAVRRACKQARDGEILLLSPGCASWDQFDNYEQRGEVFIQAARSELGDAVASSASSS